jgi:hypothetical protein
MQPMFHNFRRARFAPIKSVERHHSVQPAKGLIQFSAG